MFGAASPTRSPLFPWSSRPLQPRAQAAPGPLRCYFSTSCSTVLRVGAAAQEAQSFRPHPGLLAPAAAR
eukprot:4386111-Pyramimonas_sp.AAC.1